MAWVAQGEAYEEIKRGTLQLDLESVLNRIDYGKTTLRQSTSSHRRIPIFIGDSMRYYLTI
jgi:hypothetical protein